MVENLQIYKDASELIKRDFLSYLIRISKDMNIVTEKQYGLYIERSVPCV